jgi:hypothetical protein
MDHKDAELLLICFPGYTKFLEQQNRHISTMTGAVITCPYCSRNRPAGADVCDYRDLKSVAGKILNNMSRTLWHRKPSMINDGSRCWVGLIFIYLQAFIPAFYAG